MLHTFLCSLDVDDNLVGQLTTANTLSVCVLCMQCVCTVCTVCVLCSLCLLEHKTFDGIIAN